MTKKKNVWRFYLFTTFNVNTYKYLSMCVYIDIVPKHLDLIVKLNYNLFSEVNFIIMVSLIVKFHFSDYQEQHHCFRKKKSVIVGIQYYRSFKWTT